LTPLATERRAVLRNGDVRHDPLEQFAEQLGLLPTALPEYLTGIRFAKVLDEKPTIMEAAVRITRDQTIGGMPAFETREFVRKLGWSYVSDLRLVW
jgi:hypothetical protein